MQPIFDHHCHVLEHRPCGNGLKVLTLRAVHTPFACTPGQFVMVDLPSTQFFFRRPFSVLATYEDNVFELFYKVVGQGTKMMAQLAPGDEVNVLAPLGGEFTPPTSPETTLLIGGGIGIAPLYFLARQLKQQGQPLPKCFYGVRSQQEIGLLSELTEVFGSQHLFISTDDGSYGSQGNVCQLLAQHPEIVLAAQEAYICGPTVMMDASVQLLKQMNPNIQIQVSLEEHMPCGIGACTGCVVERTDGQLPSKVCLDGPVFNAEVIAWPSQKQQATQELKLCSR